MLFVFLFFFKQKTAYDMRISDWSSDVCSSDLGAGLRRPAIRRSAAVVYGIKVRAEGPMMAWAQAVHLSWRKAAHRGGMPGLLPRSSCLRRRSVSAGKEAGKSDV